MYAGYLLCHVAFLLMNWTVWNAAVYALCYAAQVPRLLAEEHLLRRDERYAQVHVGGPLSAASRSVLNRNPRCQPRLPLDAI